MVTLIASESMTVLGQNQETKLSLSGIEPTLTQHLVTMFTAAPSVLGHVFVAQTLLLNVYK
jgi:hypothetical protein